MDWDTNVQRYLELFVAGFPEELRPQICPRCQWEGFQQKHAHFSRNVQALTELVVVTIHRFFCKTCTNTHSVVPSFFRPKHTFANEVQEVVVARLNNGASLNAASKGICPGITIDKKTVRRWKTFWIKTMEDAETDFIEQVLTVAPALVLPVGKERKAIADSFYGWLSFVWRQVSRTIHHFKEVCLFTRLIQLHFSLAVSVDPP